MKISKFATLVTGVAFAALCLLPGRAFADTATMSLGGNSNQTNGSFVIAVNEDSGATTINYAEADLSFSTAVSGVSVSYVAPFAQQSIPCSVTVCVAGGMAGTSVSGPKTVAYVSFTLANPGSVTVNFAGSAMYHPNPGGVSSAVTVNTTPRTFTYTAPAQTPAPAPSTPPQGGGNNAPKNNGSSNKKPATTTAFNNTTAVAGESASQPVATTSTDDKSKDNKQTSDKSSQNKPQAKDDQDKAGNFWRNARWAILGLLVAAAVYQLTRRGADEKTDNKKSSAVKSSAANKQIKKTKKA